MKMKKNWTKIYNENEKWNKTYKKLKKVPAVMKRRQWWWRAKRQQRWRHNKAAATTLLFKSTKSVNLETSVGVLLFQNYWWQIYDTIFMVCYTNNSFGCCSINSLIWNIPTKICHQKNSKSLHRFPLLWWRLKIYSSDLSPLNVWLWWRTSPTIFPPYNVVFLVVIIIYSIWGNNYYIN